MLAGCGGKILSNSEDEDVLPVGNHLETINLSRSLLNVTPWRVRLVFDVEFNGCPCNFYIMRCKKKKFRGKQILFPV